MGNTAWHHKDDSEDYDPKQDPQKKKKELLNPAIQKKESMENKEGSSIPKPPPTADMNSKIDSMMEEVIKTLNKGKGKGDLPTKHK